MVWASGAAPRSREPGLPLPCEALCAPRLPTAALVLCPDTTSRLGTSRHLRLYQQPPPRSFRKQVGYKWIDCRSGSRWSHATSGGRAESPPTATGWDGPVRGGDSRFARPGPVLSLPRALAHLILTNTPYGRHTWGQRDPPGVAQLGGVELRGNSRHGHLCVRGGDGQVAGTADPGPSLAATTGTHGAGRGGRKDRLDFMTKTSLCPVQDAPFRRALHGAGSRV